MNLISLNVLKPSKNLGLSTGPSQSNRELSWTLLTSSSSSYKPGGVSSYLPSGGLSE